MQNHTIVANSYQGPAEITLPPQERKLLTFLEENGELSARQTVRQLYILSPHRVVSRLKAKGLFIVKKMRKPAQGGRRYAVYSLGLQRQGERL